MPRQQPRTTTANDTGPVAAAATAAAAPLLTVTPTAAGIPEEDAARRFTRATELLLRWEARLSVAKLCAEDLPR